MKRLKHTCVLSRALAALFVLFLLSPVVAQATPFPAYASSSFDGAYAYLFSPDDTTDITWEQLTQLRVNSVTLAPQFD